MNSCLLMFFISFVNVGATFLKIAKQSEKM